MGRAFERRKKIGAYFLNMVRMKISGQISQKELEQRTARIPEEQLSLGIGAATELKKEMRHEREQAAGAF